MSEMVEGQEQKSQVHAANAAELQRTNAAAFEVYQKYLGAK
jgi:hypothetical protein